MKKIVLSLALLSLVTTGAMAQKNRFRTAKEYLSDNNYKKAIPEIDAASQHEDTKNNPDVWYTRGFAYYLMAADTTAKNPGAIDESANSFIRAAEVKPGFKEDVNVIFNLQILQFNNALSYYNSGDYAGAYERFIKVSDLYNKTKAIAKPENAETVKRMGDLAAQGKGNAALAALNAKREDDALRLYMELKNEQSPKDSNTYYAIVEILERQKKSDEALAVINEGLKLWPNNKPLRNSEINYYINSGKTNELLPKLESAVAADPNNAELQFILANLYERMSFPKGDGDKPAPRPANADELMAKAEAGYKKAIELNPGNSEYHYNYGVMFYEYAVLYNTQAMNVKGTTAADDKKVNDLIAKRNEKFSQALPHIEQAFNLLDPKMPNLNGDEQRTYRNSIVGLKEIYSRLDKADKLKAIKAREEAVSHM